MVQVMRSLVVLSVPLTILCNGWLHHQILEGTDIHLKDIIALVAALSEDGRERQKLCLPLVFHQTLGFPLSYSFILLLYNPRVIN